MRGKGVIGIYDIDVWINEDINDTGRNGRLRLSILVITVLYAT